MANGTAALSLLGTLSSSYAKYQAGLTRKRISEANERISEIQAEEVKKRGAKEEARSRRAYKKLLGKQRVAMAAQGISLRGGTSQQLQQETKTMSELDALTIRLNTAREALGFEQASVGERFAGKMEERASRTEALSTLLTGGLRSYELYKRGQR